MTDDSEFEDGPQPREPSKVDPYIRAGMNAAGSIPFIGSLIAAAAGFWCEKDQEALNNFIRAQLEMMQDEMREKYRVLGEVIVRLDVHDEEIKQRIKSDEYQRILKKAFRNWAGTESRKKQEYVRNLLTNAAAAKLVSDDVVLLFLQWLEQYSEFHFEVIGEIYKARQLTRGTIWSSLGKKAVREDSAEADLFKLLIRDLSTGGVIRQHRETDGYGNFVKERSAPVRKGQASRTMTSAFDQEDRYELTALGQQFIHYVMTELTPKIAYNPEKTSDPPQPAGADDA